MAVTIVDALEVVDVAQPDHAWPALVGKPLQMALDSAAVAQAGQLVALRVVARGFQLLPQGGDFDCPGVEFALGEFRTLDHLRNDLHRARFVAIDRSGLCAQFPRKSTRRCRRRGCGLTQSDRLVAQGILLRPIGASPRPRPHRTRHVKPDDLVGVGLAEPKAIGGKSLDHLADRRTGVDRRDIGDGVVFRRRRKLLLDQEGKRFAAPGVVDLRHLRPGSSLRPQD